MPKSAKCFGANMPKSAKCLTILEEKSHKSLGVTIVMVTHNEHDAKIAHRIVRLFDGQIVDE